MDSHYEPWPGLDYNKFASTGYLLHMGLQVIGKLKLTTPFEPQWANVPLWVTSRGLTTGPIPYNKGVFQIDIDFISHKVICTTSWQYTGEFKLQAMSVAAFTNLLFQLLTKAGINIQINMMPQEVLEPVAFDKDTKEQEYNKALANAWWRILASIYRVMQSYHARFMGKTPPIGFMWGTFDIRDARYQGDPVPTTGINAEFIRRNAMNEAQVEAGWWSGNANYPRPAFYSFIYPQPEGIEFSKIKPSSAHWDKSLGLFILDYADIHKSKTPDEDLLLFLNSAYEVEAQCAGWDKALLGTGRPM